MKSGQVFKTFTAKDGRTFTLRTPRWTDLDDLLTYINVLADENPDTLNLSTRKTREEEANWLSRKLAAMEHDRTIVIVADHDGFIVSCAEVERKRGTMHHVGEIGISVLEEYRDIGIGTELLTLLIEEAKTIGLHVLMLEMYAHNERARHVYTNVGFQQTGIIPKGYYKDEKYTDNVIMTRIL